MRPYKVVSGSSPAYIRPVLASYQGCEIQDEFIRRSKDHQRIIQEQKQLGRFCKIDARITLRQIIVPKIANENIGLQIVLDRT
ncbi:unnamed protein product [Trifolium pratense]|uniref:Uncharacterized protein n=1 Tax=Trifolium pratense TaxID=57577 RepID=A0ACB0J696_TRIPR|nr:unnamed protein product [Trifolium pratense]